MDIETLRQICLSLPAVTEDVKWENDLCFSVGGKMFCIASLEPPFKCSFKVADEEFEAISQQPGFMPAPYLARARWVAVTGPEKISRKAWEAYLQQSHKLVAAKLTKKTKAELGI